MGLIWFSGQDTANALGYKENNRAEAVRTHVPKTDKLPVKKINVYIKGIHGDTIYIDEIGLYTFITASGMPIAKKFVRWINSEVIPSIRKYGQYKLKQELENQQTELFKKINYLEKENTVLKNDLKKDIYPDGGLVYVIDHSYDDRHIFRIGMTKDMNSRKKVHDTHTPHKNVAVIIKKTNDPIRLETCVRSMLYDYRIKNKKDFYECEIARIRYAFNKCIRSINDMDSVKNNGRKMTNSGSKTSNPKRKNDATAKNKKSSGQQGGQITPVDDRLRLSRKQVFTLQKKIDKIDKILLKK